MQLDRGVNPILPGSIVIVLLHLFLRPRLKIGIGEIGDTICRLLSRPIGNVGMKRIVAHEGWATWGPNQVAGRNPTGLV